MKSREQVYFHYSITPKLELLKFFIEKKLSLLQDGESRVTGLRTLLPHGHSEKTDALRADILTDIFIYRMDR